MGDPKFARPKTSTPAHPWKAARIQQEYDLREEYGLKKISGRGGGRREIWRELSALRRHRNQAMKLIGRVDTSEGHFAREKNDLVESLYRKGLLSEGAGIDEILQITVQHMLDRRLQSVVYYKGLAPTMRSARHLIVHGHISIDDQRMTVPGYHVLREEQDLIQYSSNSPYNDPEHDFRKSLELSVRDRISDEEEEVPERDADAEFVEQIKSDSAKAPTVQDTVPENEGGESND